jgi:hypothetical protein
MIRHLHFQVQHAMLVIESLKGTSRMTHKLFAVVSWGCAATAWLAKALNSHPDIFCTHSGNGHWKAHGRAPDISGSELMAVLDAIADSCYLAAGDVHGLSREDVEAVRTLFGDQFNAVVLVREPMARLRSQVALFKQANYRGWAGLDYVEPLAKAAGFDPSKLTIEQMHFIHGANMLNAIIKEKSIGKIYRCEDVTSDPSYLVDILLELTGETVAFTPAWAAAAVASKKVNAHSANQTGWNAFEARIIRSVVKTEAWEEYYSLGYPEVDLDDSVGIKRVKKLS